MCARLPGVQSRVDPKGLVPTFPPMLPHRLSSTTFRFRTFSSSTWNTIGLGVECSFEAVFQNCLLSLVLGWEL